MAENTTLNQSLENSKDFFTRKIEAIVGLWRQIITTMIVVLLVIALYSYASSKQEVAEKKVWKATAEALLLQNNSKIKDALQLVMKKNSGTEGIFYSQIELIRLHFQDGEYAKARLLAEEFMEKYPKNYFFPFVKLEHARLLEWEGRWQQAREEYEKIVKLRNVMLQPEALWGMARCLEQENKFNDAREEYKKIRALAIEEGWNYSAQIVSKAADYRLMALEQQNSINTQTVKLESVQKKDKQISIEQKTAIISKKALTTRESVSKK